MRQTIVALFSSLLLFLFAYTAISKLWHIQQFIAMLKRAPFLSWGADILAWSVSLTELCIVLLLLFSRTRRAGLRFAIAMLALFTVYLIVLLSSGVKLPCSCGGIISSLSWQMHLYVNLFFLGIAVAAERLSGKRQKNDSTATRASETFFHA